MRMRQGVRTGLGHGGITCVLQTQFSSFSRCAGPTTHLIFKVIAFSLYFEMLSGAVTFSDILSYEGFRFNNIFTFKLARIFPVGKQTAVYLNRNSIHKKW